MLVSMSSGATGDKPAQRIAHLNIHASDECCQEMSRLFVAQVRRAKQSSPLKNQYARLLQLACGALT